MWLDLIRFPGMGPLSGSMSWKRLRITIFSYKAISSFFYISAPYFLEMFMSVRYIFNQTAIGMLLDPVKFSGMGP